MALPAVQNCVITVSCLLFLSHTLLSVAHAIFSVKRKLKVNKPRSSITPVNIQQLPTKRRLKEDSRIPQCVHCV